MRSFEIVRHCSIVLVFLVVSIAANTQQLSPVEQKIISAVDAQNAESIDFLEQLVNVNSGTMNTAGVHRIADMFTPRFRALGFEVRWIPMDEVHRAGDLIAVHPTANGKRILLIGHLDTVFAKDSEFQSWKREGDIAIGPGSTDIKGGDMVLLAALEALQSAGVLKDASITVVLTGDEEHPGLPISISRRDLIDMAMQSDIALDFEAATVKDGIDYGSTSRRSSIIWNLKATGATGHSSGIFNPSVGYGAIYELVRSLDAFRQQLPEKDLTFNVGYVVGGSTATVDPSQTAGQFTAEANVIPPIAYANGDIRTISDEQTQRVEEKMNHIVSEHLPKTDASIEFLGGYPAMPPTAGNRALLGIMNQVNTEAGFPLMHELDPLERGAGDISFVAKYLDSLAGLGAVGGRTHQEGEFIDLSHQPTQVKRAALFLYTLSKIKRSSPLADGGQGSGPAQ
jgi:glutamate carboxypeptidase